ncbi:MAG: hypothetical protein IKK24_05100 [Clostridia bacterium]|nr:hypothetical protein [Clostridia bacterium]
MKKLLDSKFRFLALVLSVIMLFTCLSVGFGSLTVSAEDVFTTESDRQQEVDGGCYRTSFYGDWAKHYFKKQVHGIEMAAHINHQSTPLHLSRFLLIGLCA